MPKKKEPLTDDEKYQQQMQLELEMSRLQNQVRISLNHPPNPQQTPNFIPNST